MASRGCFWIVVLKLVTYSYHGPCNHGAEDIGNGVRNSAPRPVVSEVPSVSSAGCAEGLGEMSWGHHKECHIWHCWQKRQQENETQRLGTPVILKCDGWKCSCLKASTSPCHSCTKQAETCLALRTTGRTILLSRASSETDEGENGLPTVTNTQYTFRDMNSGLQSFLLVSLIAGSQLVSLWTSKQPRPSLFYKRRAFLHSHQQSVLQHNTWETQSQQLTRTSGAREAQAALEDGSEDPVMIAAANYLFLFIDCKKSQWDSLHGLKLASANVQRRKEREKAEESGKLGRNPYSKTRKKIVTAGQVWLAVFSAVNWDIIRLH